MSAELAKPLDENFYTWDKDSNTWLFNPLMQE